ncbi:N-acetylmuramoyl-L-alanine amidase CwlA [Bacillus paralicheniformis]|nr:N-acetylmuramoyl-L-alanine amidase CwlA [Bacillus paralicheniformis]
MQEPLKGLMNMNDTAEYVGSSVLILQRKKKKLSSSVKKSSYTLPAGIFKIKSPLMKGTAVRRIQEALAALYFYPYKEAKNNNLDMAATGRKRRTRSNGSS